jgi:hypothetical protein
MKKNKYIYAYSMLLLLVACTDNKTEKISETQIHSIDKTIEKFDYPCKLSVLADTFIVKITFDSTNYYSSLYVPNALDLLIKNISKDLKQNNKLKLITISNQSKYNAVYNYTYNEVKYIDSVFNDNSTITVFKKYIYKNIKQEELLRFNLIVNNILENMENSQVKTADYIDVVLKYSKECENPRLGNFYTNLLIETRKFALSDLEWWPDFNPQDVDYFLDYCNRNDSKKI